MGVEGSVSSIRASIATMRTYLAGIDGWYAEYDRVHVEKYCKNLTGKGLAGDVRTSKEDVRNVIETFEKYLDDTEWIGRLRSNRGMWNAAARACAEADLDVANKKLRARESWEGGAGSSYRGTVRAQHRSLEKAELAAEVMAAGCGRAADAGVTFFAELAAAFKAAADDLPMAEDFPAWAGQHDDKGSNPQSQTSYGHDLQRRENSCDSHIDDVGKETAATCSSDAKLAWVNLDSQIAFCFKTYPPYAYPVSGAAPNVSLQDYVQTWPPAPGQA